MTNLPIWPILGMLALYLGVLLVTYGLAAVVTIGLVQWATRP